MQAQTLIDIHLIRHWAVEAGKIALSRPADQSVDLKSDLTPVTEMDRRLEAFLLEQIDRHYPGHGVLAEEGSSRAGSEFTWIIDPLDGTRAYASGLPIWGISIGVFHRDEPYAGVFYMPVTGDIFWGSREEAFHNDHRLVPRPSVPFHSPLAFFLVPSNAHRHFEISFPRIRSLGSAAAHLAYVAHGAATAAVTRRIRIWDMAAVLPYLGLSQTRLVYLDGTPFQPADLIHGEIARQPLIAAHASILDQVRACVRLKEADAGSGASL